MHGPGRHHFAQFMLHAQAVVNLLGADLDHSVARCRTSQCVLPVINLAPLDNDW